MKNATLFKSLIFTIFLLLFFTKTIATHVMGASFYYECDSTCKYRFYQSVIFECGSSPTSMSNPVLMVATSIGGINCDTTAISDWNLISSVDVTPICPGIGTRCTNFNNPIVGGVESTFYFDTLMCSSTCPILRIEMGSGGRNFNSTALPVNESIYLQTDVNLSGSLCNNSPQFRGLAAPYVCAGSPAYLDQHAFDPDGDSLVYSLTPCLRGVNWILNILDTVNYNPGYSYLNPLGPSWRVNIDRRTGIVTLIPNPGNIVVGNLCIQVEEYRNGILIGTVWQDLQVTVISCSNQNFNPQLDSMKLIQGGKKLIPNQFSMCLDDTFKMDLYVSDPDSGQQVSFRTLFQHTGLVVDTSQISIGIISLSFKPVRPGLYTVPFFLLDTNCPISGSFSQTFVIRVEGVCVNGSTTPAPCGQAVGTIDLTVTSGSPPFQFLWSNGDTTEDIANLLPGVYSVQITDANGYSLLKGFLVNATSISIASSVIHPECNRPKGSIIINNIMGGIGPYGFNWNTGDTTQNLSNIPFGIYTLTITDSTGCTYQESWTLNQPDSCYNLIKGIVYEDSNKNCMEDSGEIPLPYIIVDMNPGGAVMTNLQGEYEFMVDTGDYTLSLIPPRNKFPVCPSNGTQTFRFDSLTNYVTGQNLGLFTDSLQDLRITYHQSRARPGFVINHYLRVYNDGDKHVNAIVTWTHDSIFDYVGSFPLAGSYDPVTRKGTWVLFQLAPNQNKEIRVITRLKTGIGTGVTYNNHAIVDPIHTDSFPNNNDVSFGGTTTNSYDPNDKNVQPPGLGNFGLIEQHEKEVSYTIRFQNTGTDTAFTVVIRDTLPLNSLYPLSFQRQFESHPYSLFIEKDHILVFRFENIKLPDSTTNVIRSQGYVTFSLTLKDSLPLGTSIRNSAAIYFDFNAPIITNSTLNTVFAYPQLSLGTDTTICEGNPVMAHVTSPGLPPYRFDWSDGSIDPNNATGLSQTNVNGSGNYQVTITDALGIQASGSVVITAAPLADAAFNISPVGLTVAFTNTSNVNSNWQWDFGDGQTATGALAQVHTYGQNGLYTVTLITSNDCGSDTLTQEVDLRNVAIDDALFAQSVKLVPHPVQDVSKLRFANMERESYRLRIIDLQGRVVKELGETRADSFEISRSELASGIYMYELIGYHSYFGKMVVK